MDNGVKDWTKNPGRTANIYHRKFSAKIEDDSLQQIQSAILIGATYKEHKGYHDRNSKVAESRYLIAFTWGDTDIPKKGGTRVTWDKSQGRKIHIPLSSLIIQSTLVSPTKMKKKTTPGKEPSKAETPIQTHTYKTTDTTDQPGISKRKEEVTCDTQLKQFKLEDEHVTNLCQRKRSFLDFDIVEESPPTKKTDSTSVI